MESEGENMAPRPYAWHEPREWAVSCRGIPHRASSAGVHPLHRARGVWGAVCIPVIMFLATVVTTLVAGAMQQGVSPGAALSDLSLLIYGLPFSGTLLLILGAHELGHYFASRRWGVDASLPLFIPAPSLIGTFGAVIRIRSRIDNRNALMDVAVAGPLAGMMVALPAVMVGLAFSKIISPDSLAGASAGIKLGTPLLFDGAKWLVLGSTPPGADVLLHPIAFAGWCGFLVTSLNLIPAGQLDGGHIVYTLFGQRHRGISRVVGVILLLMGYWWPGWILWAAIVLFLGRRHPPVADEWLPLSRGRRLVGYFCIGAIFLTFTMVPVQIF